MTATAPIVACAPVRLIAAKTYVPSTFYDATWTAAAPIEFALPDEIPVTQGNSGNHWVDLTISGPTSEISCRYRGGSDQAHPVGDYQLSLARRYRFLSCSDGSTPGTVVTARRLGLHLANGGNTGPTDRTEVTLEIAPTRCQPPPAVVEGDSGVTVLLDDVVYRDGDSARVSVRVDAGFVSAIEFDIVLACEASPDAERVRVRRTAPGRYESVVAVPVQVSSTAASTADNGTLTVRPGARFFALYAANPAEEPGLVGSASLVFDWAIGARTTGLPPVPIIDARAALTPDDIAGSAPAAIPPFTVDMENSVPVQLAANRLIVHPRNEADLAEILLRTGGTVIDQLPYAPARGYPQSALVEVDTDRAPREDFRDLLANQEFNKQLAISAERGRDLLALAMALQQKGFSITVDPRLQWHGPPRTTESVVCPTNLAELQNFPQAATCFAPDEYQVTTATDRIGNEQNRDEAFQTDRAWAELAIQDLDRRPVRVAFLDTGFAPNADFPPIYRECNMEGRTNALRCGLGAATGAQSVGNSFFGDRSWHGTSMVSLAAARLNNGFGTRGVAGQVAQVGLYNYDAFAYVWNIGNGIDQAVRDGAGLINLSAGFPCQVPSQLGLTFGLCTTGGRLFTCAVLSGPAIAAALVACGLLGPFAPICASAAPVAIVGSCVSAAFAGFPPDVRSPMQRSLDLADTLGVDLIATAGNDPQMVVPRALRDLLVRTQSLDAGTFEMIPCTLPARNKLCVGGASPAAPYANTMLTGDYIDIWGTGNFQYFAPVDTAVITSPINRLSGGNTNVLGGGGRLFRPQTANVSTSEGAAFVTGTVALMRVVDPSIHGRDIRNLLQSVGTPVGDPCSFPRAVCSDPAPNVLANPFGSLIELLRRELPDPSSLGYSNQLDFDDSPLSDRAPGQTLVVGQAIFGTTVAYPGDVPYTDSDAYNFRVPVPPISLGRTRATVRVRGPLTLGGPDLPVLDPAWTPVTTPQIDGPEVVQDWTAGALYPGDQFVFSVGSAVDGRHDNRYSITLLSLVEDGLFPAADRFDIDNVDNPPESRPNNNTRETAPILGQLRQDRFGDSFTWPRPSVTNFLETARLRIARLSFGRGSDPLGTRDTEDWLLVFPSDMRPAGGGNACLSRTFKVDAGSAPVRIEIRDAGNNVVASGNSQASLTRQFGSLNAFTPLFVRVVPVDSSADFIYGLNLQLEQLGAACR